jgi:hypothetical protein
VNLRLRACHASLVGGDRRSSSGSLAKSTRATMRRAWSRVGRFGRRAIRRSNMSGIGEKRKCAACALNGPLHCASPCNGSDTPAVRADLTAEQIDAIPIGRLGNRLIFLALVMSSVSFPSVGNSLYWDLQVSSIVENTAMA